MRQIGDQWRPSPDTEEKKSVDLGMNRPLTPEEETLVDNYYNFRFKTRFNNLCTQKFFSNSNEEFIMNFNKCSEKMHEIESLFYKVKKEYSKEVDLYASAGLDNLKY